MRGPATPEGKTFTADERKCNVNPAPFFQTRWVGPELGEHTAEILERLGYGEAERNELKRKGVI